MTKIERLRAMPIRGNAMDDQPLLQLADDIIMDGDAQLADRYEALVVMDRACGGSPQLDLKDEAACQRALNEYIEFSLS